MVNDGLKISLRSGTDTQGFHKHSFDDACGRGGPLR